MRALPRARHQLALLLVVMYLLAGSEAFSLLRIGDLGERPAIVVTNSGVYEARLQASSNIHSNTVMVNSTMRRQSPTNHRRVCLNRCPNSCTPRNAIW